MYDTIELFRTIYTIGETAQMHNRTYFYQFLEPVSKELMSLACELENIIFKSPRMMLTHARVFVENVLKLVIQAENLSEEPMTNLKERIDLLYLNGYITSDIRDELHIIRKNGNEAAHDSRMFRYSEALSSWEAVYKVVKWYIEVYGPVNFTVPEYQDPSPDLEQQFDITELEIRLKTLEKLLESSVNKLSNGSAEKEAAVTSIEKETKPEIPGFTTIRTISYKGDQLEIPYFLRDAFLLPQRFPKSETFLIRLGAEQQARLMSELPKNLEGLHKYVKRFNEKNDEIFFKELKTFVEEEKARRQLMLKRPGELFLFYKADYIIVTENLAEIPLTPDEFKGIPNLLRQLNEDEIETVGHLPNELVILAKYENVGIGTVEKLFEQLKAKQ
jgi:hypothetical protein